MFGRKKETPPGRDVKASLTAMHGYMERQEGFSSTAELAAWASGESQESYTERMGSRSQSPGPKITATRPLPGPDLDDSGIPKPHPIPSVHSRIPGAYERTIADMKQANTRAWMD